MNRFSLGLGLALALTMALTAFAIFKPILVLPRIALAPGLSLVQQTGERVAAEDLHGQLVLYNFTYSRCQPPCFTSPRTAH